MQDELIAGDSLNFPVSALGYSAADGWVLNYRLVPRMVGDAVLSLTGTADGAGWLVSATAAVTASWAAGSYGWASWVELGAESYSVGSGQLLIKPNPRTAAVGVDTRSPTAIALDDARAAYRAFSPARLRYKIGNREMEFNSAAEILTRINWLQHEFNREERAAGRLSAAANSMGGRIYLRAGG